MTTPAPQEARQALDAIQQRREQSATAARSSRWWWIGSGLFLIGYGVAQELAPDVMRNWGSVISMALLFLSIARSSRWGSHLFGRQVSPRLTAKPVRRFGVALVFAITLVALALGAGRLQVPHFVLWYCIAGGLLVMLAGPWWENRVLTRVSNK
ncbi:hypothetical protein [Actinoplanes sp. TFC3]|uniref:hypothetical protein n=1 Tax=Actinoplanes sp. TFC3 TaxID=1710355 RepID=UPI0008320A27|nr:hypothetical protein [Actinoplanes sp. TFC3]